jgi:hypothetical protein
VAEAGMERVFYLCYSLVLRSLVICCVSLLSGRSAAWLARLVRDQEVEGSNPFAPTTFPFPLIYLRVCDANVFYRICSARSAISLCGRL